MTGAEQMELLISLCKAPEILSSEPSVVELVGVIYRFIPVQFTLSDSVANAFPSEIG